ncbi:unnamed protein product [Parascedosporium putredinis]|uniref:Uncharacterized protein n=1 Tax=Parascedosporium putredinis TaxID=1442378 RepID=A0A9P1HA09_9PEZI|nr:unnamed protein product [Parascedosporium putredinis]CAI8000932.1 unnamed protein product [Parascedosporium putredinis]
MTSLKPREPYSPAELRALYPPTSSSTRSRSSSATAREPPSPPAPPRDVCLGRRRLPKLVWGPHGNVDSICDNGTLTDQGRQSTHALGARLRDLYVDKLRFLPGTITSTDWMYLRATPIPRARESLQQAFLGLYPDESRAPNLPAPAIISRNPAQETLYPNDLHCRRLAHLARQFSLRAAQRWNDSPELRYITNRIGKWMPPEPQRRHRLQAQPRRRHRHHQRHPRPRACHPPAPEFYDPKLLEIGEKLAIEEWFFGYAESNEYRKLGIGSLLGDITQRMVVSSAQLPGVDPRADPRGDTQRPAINEELTRTPKGRISTLDQERWGPKEQEALDGWYVRIRYNDEPIVLPGCRKSGNHLDGDVSFCTLSAFKSIVDKFTPTNWRRECRANIDAPAFPEKPEPAGY